MWTTMAGGSRESSAVSHAPRAAAWSFITTTGKEVQWHESKNTSALILLLSNKRPYQVHVGLLPYAGTGKTGAGSVSLYAARSCKKCSDRYTDVLSVKQIIATLE